MHLVRAEDCSTRLWKVPHAVSKLASCALSCVIFCNSAFAVAAVLAVGDNSGPAAAAGAGAGAACGGCVEGGGSGGCVGVGEGSCLKLGTGVSCR